MLSEICGEREMDDDDGSQEERGLWSNKHTKLTN
jgi:hypothetical protein